MVHIHNKKVGASYCVVIMQSYKLIAEMDDEGRKGGRRLNRLRLHNCLNSATTVVHVGVKERLGCPLIS